MPRLFWLPLAASLAPSFGQPSGSASSSRAGTGVFEPWLEELWAREGHPHAQRRLAADDALDLRVAKGLGPKGYNKVRISVVAPSLEEFPDFNFSYRQQFRYRWTENYLHSELLDLEPGANSLSIGGQKIVVDLPAEDAGVRAMFWSDPCFSSKWVHCEYASRFQTFDRSVSMLNTVYQDPSMNMFSILGDNFYDQTGELAKTLFAQLSPDVKRRFMFVVNGNHDNWVCGYPGCGDVHDNFGHGQMQYYTADPVASTLVSDGDFMDFSVNPDERREFQTFQNVGTNFLVYHKLGNVGFLGFSGAAPFEEMQPHFEEACEYFQESKPAVVFLLGHWNSEGMGCVKNMAVPETRAALLSLPQCAFLGDRLKYMDGHEHCNYVQEHDSEPFGFMIGAHGMSDRCEAQYGFLFLDSTDGRVRLHYFELASDSKGDRFEEIHDCVAASGLAGCTQYAETWLDIAAEEPAASKFV